MASLLRFVHWFDRHADTIAIVGAAELMFLAFWAVT